MLDSIRQKKSGWTFLDRYLDKFGLGKPLYSDVATEEREWIYSYIRLLFQII
ncbi:MAG: hypothetical protein IPL98_15045 [Saprospiraceae bacterium]|nr:hypothetical protein [Saprospiraceae bacterium]